MQKKFTVKSYTWVNGLLKSENHQFSELDSALHFSKYHGCDQSKLTDQQGRVIYQQKNNYVPDGKPKTVRPKNKNYESYA